MRLIDADGLIDEICRDQCERKYKDCDSTCEIAAYVVNAPTVGGWISVKDKTPEINEPILFTGKNTIGNRYPAQKGYFSGDEWYSFGLTDKCSDGVTHWMPLPEPPKEKSCNDNG